MAASAFVAALVALAAAGLSRWAGVRRARRGFELMAALPQHLLEAGSTLRGLYGIVLVISVSAMAHPPHGLGTRDSAQGGLGTRWRWTA